MITNDIQQLLDGSLDDEQAAELLHTLSVSPEKRVAFQQHLALGALMSQDRAAIALSPEEQAAIWGNIKGNVDATAAAASRPARWLGRGAALLTAGVIGYLLGTVTLFSPASVEVVQAPPVAAPRLVLEGAPVVHDSIIYRDRVVYRDRDRIVYRDRIVNSRSNDAAPSLAARNRAESPAERQPNAIAPTSPQSQPTPRNPIEQPAPLAPAQAAPPVSSSGPPIAVPDSASINNGKSQPTGPVDTAMAVRPPRSIANMTPEVDPRQAPDVQIASAFDRNGWEVSASERFGMLLPAPKGIDDADGKFSYRNADLAYRFAEGRVSVGGRLVYGTFSAFSLEPDATSSLTFADAVPSLAAEEKFWGEVFAGYRFPLSSMFAIGGEVSFGRSADHMKIGGDLLLTAMLTEKIGVQLGGGFGRYWYDLAAERERLFNEHENVGIRDVASQSYDGPIIEGRYGLFFNF